MKQCRSCGEVKALEDFCVGRRATARRKEVRHANCKACDARKARIKRLADPSVHRATLYKSNLRANWGMSVEEFEAKREAQGGGCAICGGQNVRGRLAVDHCHKTGTIRGLLCTTCNTGLGSFKDEPHLLHKAVEYLMKYRPLEGTR